MKKARTDTGEKIVAGSGGDVEHQTPTDDLCVNKQDLIKSAGGQ
jgi:hypothetical protein